MKHLDNFKIYEYGSTYKSTKQKYSDEPWKGGSEKIEKFSKKIKDLIKSKGLTFKTVGTDLEVFDGSDKLGNIMFRKDFVGVKKLGSKFTSEFDYEEFGKIKKEINKLNESNS